MMYNDERNLYHYTYRRDGSEITPPPTDDYQPARGPVQEMKPVKKNRVVLKITALALCCALLGGGVGGGVVWAAMGRGGDSKTTTQSVPAPGNTSSGGSGGAAPAVAAAPKVDGQTPLTDKEVYAANVDSVVSINTTGTTVTGSGFWQSQQPTKGAGSGFVLTPDGYIATNYHVIGDADTIQVTFYNGDSYDAEVVGGDEDYDIAVIKVEAEDLQPVTIGDSATLNVGDHVLAIGNPLGELTFSMSGGMVSCVDRAINVDGTPFNMIQTDTSINPGNSGGPLFNQYGEVVGIVSAKYATSANGDAVEGLGFAIPINDVFSMVKDIMTNGYVTNRAYLGITPQTMNETWASQFSYDQETGVFVCSVEAGSAAEKAGLKMGDVITKVDDTEIKTVEDLNLAKKKYSAGDTAALEVYRPDGTVTLEVTWDAAPQEEQAQDQPVQQQPSNGSGGYGDRNDGNGGYYGDPFDMFRYFFG